MKPVCTYRLKYGVEMPDDRQQQQPPTTKQKQEQQYNGFEITKAKEISFGT